MRIDVATSGFKAIELAKSVKYDIIFMDHMMPEMDGLETTKHIRELPGEYYKELPIVALTANAVSDARELFLANGMNDFLAKPIEMNELHRILKKFVQSKAPAGYMEEHLANNVETKREKTGSAQTPPGSLSAMLSPVVQGLQMPNADGSVLGQLLTQNNALLSQNMLLLQSLLGGTPASAISRGVSADRASSAMRVTENELIGADVTTVGLPGTIPEINMVRALETYGGSVQVYHGILATYYKDISEREPALRELFADRDIENFTISVHAIKSASREVGADALGEFAAHMEQAGHDEDWQFIDVHFGSFIDELDTVRDNVGVYVKDHIQVSGEELGREMLESFSAEIVDELKEACERMEYAVAEEKLGELDAFRYPEALSSMLASMIKCCSEFEYDKLDQLVQTL